MTNEVITKRLFELRNITTPRIESVFFSAPNDGDFQYAFRLVVHIATDNLIQVLLGTRVTSAEKYDGENHKVVCTAEVLGEFMVPDALGIVKTGSDIPGLPNMVAMIYPFIREKIFYCFSSNQYNLIMPTLVVQNLVTEKIKDGSLQITDSRKKTEENTAST
jgi:hypothetical protein